MLIRTSSDLSEDADVRIKDGYAMKGLIRFIFHFIILVLVIGTAVRWMVGRSYSDPEVHYFHIEEKSAAGDQNSGTEALRFAVLSDLYNYVFEGGNGVISDRIANTSPDAILICGNMIRSDAEDTMVVENLIKSLSQIAPVYYAYGDQERGYVRRHSEGTAEDPLRAAIEKSGGIVLDEEFKDAVIYGVPVRIGAVADKAYELTNLRGDVKKKHESTYKFLSAFQETGDLRILMSNDPANFIFGDACEKWGVDILLCGHILGGRAVLPYYGGVFGNAQGYFPEYVHGLYDKGNAAMLITSGLSAPKELIPRFNNPPEIAILDIEGLDRAAAKQTENKQTEEKQSEEKQEQE